MTRLLAVLATATLLSASAPNTSAAPPQVDGVVASVSFQSYGDGLAVASYLVHVSNKYDATYQPIPQYKLVTARSGGGSVSHQYLTGMTAVLRAALRHGPQVMFYGLGTTNSTSRFKYLRTSSIQCMGMTEERPGFVHGILSPEDDGTGAPPVHYGIVTKYMGDEMIVAWLLRSTVPGTKLQPTTHGEAMTILGLAFAAWSHFDLQKLEYHPVGSGSVRLYHSGSWFSYSVFPPDPVVINE